MGLKILHSADWHLDSPFTGFPAEQRLLLQQKQRQIPGRVGQLIQKEGCDLVLLAGDLFDGIPSRESIELLREAFRDWKVPVLIAPGNHDFCGPGSVWEAESWPENVHIFSGSLESVVFPELNCRVYGAGYKNMDCPGLLADFRTEGAEMHQLGLLHGDPVTANSPYCPITAAQVRVSGLDYLALGHIHKAGSFRSGQTLCAWPGCPMGRGWDETGDKGVYLVTLEETAELRWIPMNLLRFFSHNVENVEDLEDILSAVGSEDFYRITLTGYGPVDVEAIRKKYAHFPNLQLIDRTEAPVDLWADAGEDTLRGVYFRMLRDISEEEPNAILAAQISRKLLEGREVLLP